MHQFVPRHRVAQLAAPFCPSNVSSVPSNCQKKYFTFTFSQWRAVALTGLYEPLSKRFCLVTCGQTFTMLPISSYPAMSVVVFCDKISA